MIVSFLLFAALVVDGNVPAGNIVVEKIEGDTVRLTRESRDSTVDWFYEVPFANANGAVVTPQTCRELGRDTVKVFRAILSEAIKENIP